VGIRLGAKIPNSGELPLRLGVGRMAAALESAGFDSVWFSDHIVFPQEIQSPYPFSADGKVTWPLDAVYLEPMIMLAAAAATTSTVELGTAALVLPMRNPVHFAKEAASVDAMAGGRLVLGVAVGWLREEFDALGANFDARGEVFDEWLTIARACWTGEIKRFEGKHYRIPHDLYTRPRPPRPVPILIGGMSKAALRRAGAIADGWVAQSSMDMISEREIADALDVIKAAANEAGRSGRPRVAVRLPGVEGHEAELARRLTSLADAGVDELIIDVDWKQPDGPARTLDALRTAAA